MFPGSASRLSSGLRSHPLDGGRQDLGPPELSLQGACVWGTVEGVPLELGPACVPIRRLRKHEPRAKHEKCAAGCCGAAREQQGRPAAGLQGRTSHAGRRTAAAGGPLTSTRRPMLAMCGEQSLTVSSFSICKETECSSRSESRVRAQGLFSLLAGPGPAGGG